MRKEKEIYIFVTLNGMEKVGQEQIHDLLFSEQLSWQAIIYDLINAEQLDPWDIDISFLAQKYLERVHQLEEANFFISSKVLFAASILLRIKSEILLQHDLPGLDAILFGEEEEQKHYVQERLELDEDIPELVVRTPLPRFRKVTLDELMRALSNAIITENRRIKRIVTARQQEYETAQALPKHRINIQDKLREVHARLQGIFSNREERLAFSEFAGQTSEERIATFIPLLHLDHQHQVWLEQDTPFAEIWILLKQKYEQQHAVELEKMKKEVADALKELAVDEENEIDDEE